MLTDTNEIILHIANLIEKGSQGRQQITGRYFDNVVYDDCGVCAMGACLVAVGVTAEQTYKTPSFEVLKPVNVWSWPKVAYPDGESKPFAADDNNRAPLPDVVIYLNDRLGWSFERIVAYLRGLATIPPEAQVAPRKRQRRQKA